MMKIDESVKPCENVSAELCATGSAGDNMRILKQHFKNLLLPESAIDWLCMLWHVTQVWDDVADGDQIERQDLDNAIWYSLVGMFSNPFFQANSSSLLPLVANLIMKWQASDYVERENEADARSFIWRAGFYDVVMMVVTLCHGHEKAKTLSYYVMNMYGEKLEDYLKEFSHA
jgi:hypothetical protein